MLMIMYIVSNEGKGESFSVADIQCLMTDIFGLPASRDQINGVFKNNKTWFKKKMIQTTSAHTKEGCFKGQKIL